jgi:hypothetical protein
MATTITATGMTIALQHLAASSTYAQILSPRYTKITGAGRAAITFRSATTTATSVTVAVTSTTLPTWAISTAATVAYVAYYSAATGGSTYACDAVTNEAYGAAGGNYTLTSGPMKFVSQ